MKQQRQYWMGSFLLLSASFGMIAFGIAVHHLG
jgi:hypothetical protein